MSMSGTIALPAERSRSNDSNHGRGIQNNGYLKEKEGLKNDLQILWQQITGGGCSLPRLREGEPDGGR